MNSRTDLALDLGELGASLDVQAMASLVDADAQRPTPAALLLSWSKFAERKHGYELPPEWRTALALDRGLTRELQIPRVGADAADPATPDPAPKPAETMVRRSIDAFTPWLFFKLAFADAMKLADDPSQWHLAARQMITVLGDCPHLPRNGALWRRQMTKRTRLTLSLQPGLATQETIEIRAEGHDDGVGGGYRNYSHFLLSAAEGPGLLKLTEDTGRIEIRGDGKGIMLRIRKRVTVELGRSVDERFGSTMSLGLSLLLWLWAWGFRDATQSPSDHPNNQVKSPAPDLPAELKQKSANPDVKNCIKVAVLGGGPAGMACAWLLSNPMGPGGQNAWTASQNTPAIKVDLFEKDYRLGGKAASGRRIDDDGKFRIEEHGLHVLMGCYANLLEVLKWLGVDGDLQNLTTTLIPRGDGSNLLDAWELSLGPWASRSDDRSLLAWYMAERDGQDWGGEADAALTPWLPQWLGSSPLLVGLRLLFGPNLQGQGKKRTRLITMLAQTLKLLTTTDASDARQARHDMRTAMLVASMAAPRPLHRVVLPLWQQVADLADRSKGAGHAVDPKNLALQVGLRRLLFAEMNHSADLAFQTLIKRYQVSGADDFRPESDITPAARWLRTLSRASLSPSDPDAQLVGELLELATTIAIGLEKDGLFPYWALDDPRDLLLMKYPEWIRSVQNKLDNQRLAQWLDDNGVEKGFVKRSRILDAVMAGLFTRPDWIAAGTFVNGLVRLLVTYRDAPYKLLPGGTGEAVIGPIFEALRTKGVQIHLGASVTGLVLDNVAARPLARAIEFVQVQQADPAGEFARWGPATREGWVARAARPLPGSEEKATADVFVLAIPPFGATLPGLPVALAGRLGAIHSRATIGVQHWTEGAPRFPGAIVSGLQGTFRCASAMGHLNEGHTYKPAPVYYCGDCNDEIAQSLRDDPAVLHEWLQAHAGKFQRGIEAHPPHVSINDSYSARYVCADVRTQAARPFVFESGVQNLWLAGDWTRTALSCGSIEAAVTSGLEAARHILRNLGCDVHFPIVGAVFGD